MAEAPNVWQPVILLAVLLQPLLTFYPGPTVDTLPRRAGAVLAVLTCTNTVVGEDDWGDTRLLNIQHLYGIWTGLTPYGLRLDTLSEYPEP